MVNALSADGSIIASRVGASLLPASWEQDPTQGTALPRRIQSHLTDPRHQSDEIKLLKDEEK